MESVAVAADVDVAADVGVDVDVDADDFVGENLEAYLALLLPRMPQLVPGWQQQEAREEAVIMEVDDAPADVVVTREHVGDQGAKDIEGGTVTESTLQLHVPFNLIHGDMAWAFDHGLNTMSPSPLNQLSNGGKFCNLSGIRSIGQTAWTQTISYGERDIVLPADFTNVIPTVVHGVLLTVLDHPFGQE